MNIYFKIISCILPLFLLAGLLPAKAGINAKIEIIEPYTAWFATEDVDFFLRITNTGDKDFPVFLACNDPRRQIFFEVDDKDRHEWGNVLNLPDVVNAKKTDSNGFKVPPGQAYVMSDLDYNEIALDTPEAFRRVRVHLLVPQGGHVSSQWIDRQFVEAPDLKMEPIFTYVNSSMLRARPCGVIPLQVNDETWLFSHYIGSNKVGGRLCRVPPGSKLSFEHDLEARRLKIYFGGDEEPVVINTRIGKPVSGSERTVPQLYLWKQLAGRPFTDSWQRMVEMDEGKTEELGRTLTTIPALDSVTNQQTQQHPSKRAPMDDLSEEQASQSASSETGAEHMPTSGTRNLWIWFIGSVSSLIILLILLWLRNRLRNGSVRFPKIDAGN